MIVTDRQPDHATLSITIGRIYVHSTAMRPNNIVVISIPLVTSEKMKAEIVTNLEVLLAGFILTPICVLLYSLSSRAARLHRGTGDIWRRYT